MLEEGGRLVFVINVIGVVMIVMVFGVLVPRLFVHFQLTKVEKDPHDILKNSVENYELYSNWQVKRTLYFCW